MNQTPIDFVALCILLASAIFSADVAAVVGPYAVILISSTFGASFALAARKPETRLQAIWFFARANGISILFTVSLAQMVHHYRPDLHQQLLLAPISFFVGYANWGVLLARAHQLALTALSRLRGGGHG